MITFKQFDINFNRFKYVIESSGISMTRKKMFSVSEQFVPFENVGSKIRRDRERKLGWLIPSLLFFLLAFIVFIERLCGVKIGDGAEVFWLLIGLILFVIYAFRRKNSLLLVKENTANSIEFIGTRIYERRLNKFLEALFQQRDLYLNNKYPPYDGLTLDENIVCVMAGVQLQDGLLLKKLTKHTLKQLPFTKGYSESGRSPGVCSITTEKNARKILDKHLNKFISEGKYIFISGFSAKGYQVAIVSVTVDPYEIVKYAGTSRANYDVTTDDIISNFKQWNTAFGIRLVSIGFDFCEGEIQDKNLDYKKLAAEVYEFCPDVVDQGTETVERLEKEIKETGRILLWWD
jgi:hypothetical protein